MEFLPTERSLACWERSDEARFFKLHMTQIKWRTYQILKPAYLHIRHAQICKSYIMHTPAHYTCGFLHRTQSKAKNQTC